MWNKINSRSKTGSTRSYNPVDAEKLSATQKFQQNIYRKGIFFGV